MGNRKPGLGTRDSEKRELAALFFSLVIPAKAEIQCLSLS